jgi:hypothetical protein
MTSRIGVISALAVLATFAGGATAGAQQTSASVSGDDRRDVTIDAATRDDSIRALIAAIEEYYPIEPVRRRLADHFRRQLASDAFGKMDSAKAIRTRLTKELREISDDQHFLVDYFVRPRTYPAGVEIAGDANSDRRMIAALHNQGFESVERLPGNIGLLRIAKFEPAADAEPIAAAAMRFVAGTDALIIDLRDNGGGYGDTVTLLASYFFRDVQPLHEVRTRTETTAGRTLPSVDGPKYLDKPVYVLLSAKSFSAAEAFAYDLQALKRVTVVGETSRGGANPSAEVLLSARFGAIIPRAITRNPITGSNWDGTGVIPDLPAKADDALDVAKLAAAKAIRPSHTDDSLTSELDRIIGPAAESPRPQ